MIREQETARALQQALVNLEHKRKNLVDAPDEELVDRANEYEQARRDATPAFAAASEEFDPPETGSQPAQSPGGEVPPTAPAEAAEQAPTEASPGVPLVQPPGEVITAATLERFGPLQTFRSKIDPTIEVEATPYAFAAGTAIDVGEESPVATTQPTRVIRNATGEELGVQPNDVFNQHYDLVEGDGSVNPPAQAPAEEQAAEPAPAGEGADAAPVTDRAAAPQAEASEQPDEAGPSSAETQG